MVLYRVHDSIISAYIIEVTAETEAAAWASAGSQIFHSFDFVSANGAVGQMNVNSFCDTMFPDEGISGLTSKPGMADAAPTTVRAQSNIEGGRIIDYVPGVMLPVCR